jgi:ribosomal protein L15
VKLIGNNEIKSKYTVIVDASSKAAVKKIESAGGSVKVLEGKSKAKDNGKTK